MSMPAIERIAFARPNHRRFDGALHSLACVAVTVSVGGVIVHFTDEPIAR
jgi:hypothetical protein